MGDEATNLFVCHICAPGEVGGLERVVQGLAIGHHRRGLRTEIVSVIEPLPGSSAFSDPLRAEGVPVHEVRLPSRSVRTERRVVRDLLRELGPDVVHCHGYRPDILHGTTARGLGIPTVSTEHGSSKLGGATAFFEWLQEKLFRRASAVIAVSTRIRDRLVEEAGVPTDLVHVIPNGWAGGIDFLGREAARRTLGLDPDGPVVGFVGRLIPAKGADVFIEAIIELGDADVTAVVIGEGPDGEGLRTRVRDAGLASRVLFTGSVNPAAPLFRAFDVFVLSSRTEGTPIVLLEAMAAGVPTVVTAVGGVPQVVSDAEAVVVPPEDPPALAAAIRTCVEDPASASRRAAAAERRVSDEFSASRWLDRHERLYREVSRRRN